ncbi:hypothetical protein BOW28_05960 [Solemya velum gill symbiont]|uniref:Arm DNA-binding domain-containing protein n=1 Tax=Solemya velum gill symbiont TaxID=2340 RepID=UPI000997E7E9|nr:hypothetical protein BOW28_05960 [Solemya velum gill symbiont]OOZ27106.1 hypothetical protein BOW32_05255 [Solemya velum gill symbiont]
MVYGGERVPILKSSKIHRNLQIPVIIGSYPDGEGLYLQITKTGAKSWFYRYEVGGKGRKKGLGAYPTITLEKARTAAHECRLLRQQGLDPIDYAKQLEEKR